MEPKTEIDEFVKVDGHLTPDPLYQFILEMEESALLFMRKSEEYGRAYIHTGVLGACVALTGDVARLQKMVIQNPTHGRDAKSNLEDKLRDIVVQATIGLLMLREENWEGKSE